MGFQPTCDQKLAETDSRNPIDVIGMGKFFRWHRLIMRRKCAGHVYTRDMALD